MNRRQFIAASAAVAAAPSLFAASASTPWPATTQAATDIHDDVEWHDVRDWGLEGRAFDDTESYFDRFPLRARGVVRPAVWDLSRNTSGMSALFETDATAIHVRYTLLSDRLAMPHMPATGVSGVDLYGRDESGWHYVRTVSPTQQTVATLIQDGLAPGRRRYQLYLPLYNGVKSLEIGAHKSAAFQGVAPRKEKPILFYGTSITQGACASRPGMSFTNILARRVDLPMLNFGFSGNGRLEASVGQFLAELDPSIYVIDCTANCAPEVIATHTAPLINQLRAARPDTPILIVNQRTPTNAWLVETVRQVHDAKTAALQKAFDQLIAAGVKHLHFRNSDGLIGDDKEATVDASHPTDIGMMRYADALESELRKILKLDVL